jgi:hypothetical protein
MVDPDVVDALARAGLPTSGPVKLFHATSKAAAASIDGSGVLVGDQHGQAWMASSDEIAALHAAGTTSHASAGGTVVDAIVEIEINADDLFFAETRQSRVGDVELFYALDPGGGCPINVCCVRAWP